MVRRFGFTLNIPRELCISLPVCWASEWPYTASVLCCRVTRYGLESSCRYSLIWNTRLLKQPPFRFAWCRHQGTSAVEWRLEAPIRCSTVAERYLTWHALFFPILKAAVCVWNCSLVFAQWNGFSVEAKSKEGSLRGSSVPSQRGYGVGDTGKKAVNENTLVASRASHWLNSRMRTKMFVQGLLQKCFPEFRRALAPLKELMEISLGII